MKNLTYERIEQVLSMYDEIYKERPEFAEYFDVDTIRKVVRQLEGVNNRTLFAIICTLMNFVSDISIMSELKNSIIDMIKTTADMN